MKSLAAAIALFYFASTMAAAPYGIKGQQQAATLYSNVHQFPNNLVTNTGGINALVENGNNNILENPSFEHLTTSSSWVDNGVETGIGTAVAVVNGKKALAYLPTAETINLTQSSTLYAAQFADGVQGLAMVRIKTDAALKVCSIQAGTVSSTNCVTTATDLKWGLYKVPFILGANSNGISISSNGASVSGTVIVDDAFVGAVDLKVDAPQIQTQTTRFTSGSTGTGVTLTGADTTEGSGNYTYLSGVFTALRDINVFISCRTTNSLNAGTQPTIIANGVSSPVYGIPTPTVNYASTAHAQVIVLKGNTFFCRNDASTALTGGVSVLATNTLNTSIYTSNNGNFSSVSYTPTVTSFGTVSSSDFKYSRDGENLLINFNFSSGTHAASVGYFSLPSGLSIDFTKVPNNSPIGKLGSAATPTSGALVVYSSQPQRIYLCSDAVNVTLCNNATTWANTNFFSGTIKVPIEGWNNSNIIIGQFNGLQSCASTLACTDTFSAQITSTGTVVSGSENVDWLSGNCTNPSTGQYVCSFNTGIFTATPSCVANHSATLTYNQTLYTAGATASFISVVSGNNSAAANVAFNIVCQKQGADYIGKTAMAVASDQNVRSIGSTGVDIQSVYFGSGANCVSACTTGNCTICGQVGSKITSVSWFATGNYRLNGIDGTKYLCSGSGYSTGVFAAIFDKTTSSSTYATIFTGTSASTSGVNSGLVSIQCIGTP